MKIFLISLVLACSKIPMKRKDIKRELLSLPQDQQLKPFKSDGCSSWPEGTLNHPLKWLNCCFYHDISYYMGGTEDQRKKSDESFKQCIAEEENEFFSTIMKLGVQIGGSPSFDTSYKWGYGWNYKRGYVELTGKERNLLINMIPKEGELMSKYLDFEIDEEKMEVIRSQKVQPYFLHQL